MIHRRNISDIENLFDDFIYEKSLQGLSPKTISDYKSSFKRYYSEIHLPISQDSINSWVKFLLDKKMNPISINFYLRHIGVFTNWLINKKHIKHFKISFLKTQEPKLKMFSDDEIVKLLVKPSENSCFSVFRTWTIINFVMATGCRASTLINLKIEDLDFANKEIIYRHLKNRGVAVVPMSSSLERCLHQYLRLWDIKSNFLFPSRNNNKLTNYALAISLRKYCASRGVKPRGPHSLRHTFARQYIVNGGNAFILQRLLTHSNLSMTKKYVRLFSTDLHVNFDNYCPLDKLSKSSTITRRRDV